MNTPKKAQRSLEALFETLADTVADSGDAEIVEEFQASGESPVAAAKEIRALLADAVKKHTQRKLLEARAARQRSLNAIENARRRLPETAAAKRALFYTLIQRPALGLQFRDYKGEMTDEDIESCLEDLASLGLLDEGDQKE